MCLGKVAEVYSVPDPREVGREVDRDILIFGLDLAPLTLWWVLRRFVVRDR